MRSNSTSSNGSKSSKGTQSSGSPPFGMASLHDSPQRPVSSEYGLITPNAVDMYAVHQQQQLQQQPPLYQQQQQALYYQGGPGQPPPHMYSQPMYHPGSHSPSSSFGRQSWGPQSDASVGVTARTTSWGPQQATYINTTMGGTGMPASGTSSSYSSLPSPDTVMLEELADSEQSGGVSCRELDNDDAMDEDVKSDVGKKVGEGPSYGTLLPDADA